MCTISVKGEVRRGPVRVGREGAPVRVGREGGPCTLAVKEGPLYTGC